LHRNGVELDGKGLSAPLQLDPANRLIVLD